MSKKVVAPEWLWLVGCVIAGVLTVPGVIYCVRGLEEIVDDGNGESGKVFGLDSDSVMVYLPPSVLACSCSRACSPSIHDHRTSSATHVSNGGLSNLLHAGR
jgi:hypothetical protein